MATNTAKRPTKTSTTVAGSKMADEVQNSKVENGSERKDDLWRAHEQLRDQVNEATAELMQVTLEFYLNQLVICEQHANFHASKSKLQKIKDAFESLQTSQEALLDNNILQKSIVLEGFTVDGSDGDGPPVPITLLSALMYSSITLVNHSSNDDENIETRTHAFNPNDVKRLIVAYCNSLPDDQKSELKGLDCFPKEPATVTAKSVAQKPTTKEQAIGAPTSLMNRMFTLAKGLRSAEKDNIADMEKKIADLQEENANLKREVDELEGCLLCDDALLDRSEEETASFRGALQIGRERGWIL